MDSFFDVIIIGGGLTGLSAAETLIKRGILLKVLVIEAQGRVGGRTSTVKSEAESDTVDIGGQWVGPTQTKVLALLDRFSITKVEQEFSDCVKLPNGVTRPRLVEMINVNLIPLSSDEQSEILDFESHLDELCQKIDLDKPWLMEGAEEYDALSCKDYIDKTIKSDAAKFELMWFVQGMVSCDPKDCSFLFFVFFVASGGGVESLGDGPDGMQKWKLRGGAQQISERYYEDIKNQGATFMFSCPVKSVTKTEDDLFELRYVDSHQTSFSIKCRKVVVAMSPALALRKISFGESIVQDDKRKLYESMLPGRAVKIILSYNSAFWHCDEQHPIRVQDIPNFMVRNIFPSSVGKNPALIGLITGAGADRFTTMTIEHGSDYARMEIFKELAYMYGCSVDIASNPVEIFEKNWCIEEYAHGCFAGFFPPRALTMYGQELRTSSNGVYWASTETATEFYAYMEGALRAGENVAKDLLLDDCATT
jgi:monoamine oxidase